MDQTILSTINNPSDLKGLTKTELKVLCKELREFIVDVVSRTGGHLAPSLGVVELTVALHAVFNCPEDRIIWDVGHQSYAHKILTGRKDIFETLRQKGGISGFPRINESPCDAFGTGHASTSISAALGMAVARDMKQDDRKVIAVIGDGAMTGGMAFEALNQAGSMDRDIIIILNDNEMSIDPSVGALSSFLSRKMVGEPYIRFKNEFENFFGSVPGIGDNIVKLAKKWKDTFKSFFTSGLLFQALDFEYVGPIKGHRLDRLLETFQKVRNIKGPTLVHIMTTKGKGYKPAEKNPSKFHGIGPFNKQTGETPPKVKSAPLTYTNVFGKTLVDLAKKDDRIIAITAAMPEGTGLSLFAKEFPDRFFDVGIAEQHSVTFAAGMAKEGFRPVVAIYSTFMQRAFDQIIHDVALQNIPVIFAMDRSGIVGQDGGTHHGAFDISFMKLIPNMIVMAPGDEEELKNMLGTALKHNGPVSIRYPRGKGTGMNISDIIEPVTIGRARVLRNGDDCLVIAIGAMVKPCIDAAIELEKDGINITLVDARFAKPVDEKLIISLAKKCSRIITVEENVISGGFGSSVLRLLAEHSLISDFKMLGLPDAFVEHGTQAQLRHESGLDAAGIKKEIKQMVKGKGSGLKLHASN